MLVYSVANSNINGPTSAAQCRGVGGSAVLNCRCMPGCAAQESKLVINSLVWTILVLDKWKLYAVHAVLFQRLHHLAIFPFFTSQNHTWSQHSSDSHP